MKTAALLAFAFLTTLLSAQEADERVVLVPWAKAPREVPLFFSATAEVRARVGLDEVTSEQKIHFRIHQGKAETLTLALVGAGEVTEVTGAALRDWALRVAEDGSRFLDIRPAQAAERPHNEIEVLVKTRSQSGLPLPGPGGATGFSLSVELTTTRAVELKVIRADGLTPVESQGTRRFVGTGIAALEFEAVPAGTGAGGLELADSSLAGSLAADGGSISFRLSATARATRAGAVVDLLAGGPALTGNVSGDGWHVALRQHHDTWNYQLVAEREGLFPIELDFDVPVTRKGDWRSLSFHLPAGVVVPVTLAGLADGIEFDPALAVVPRRANSLWRGFLPASGAAALAWHGVDPVADGDLFFASSETTDIRVGSGLLRQLTVIDLRVLQGKLSALTLTLDGPGEVLSVEGASVIGWTVRESNGRRLLETRLGRPIEGSERLIIEAQTALGGFPVRSEALRVAPEGTLRHSGWLRVANEGAVRIEVAAPSGLIQLAPGQFPGGVNDQLRQVFVYRFPAADYSYAVQANQVMPEVGLTEVTVYELGETDRRISADIELDIREAPLREWEMEIPADHAVAAVTGAEVADYVVGSDAKDGKRSLKILFKQAVADRQLVSIRLEKNEPAAAGVWKLDPLGFPGVKSHRGYIGAVAAAGFRLAAGPVTGVAEVPVTFFPRKTDGLQQAFRLREDPWSASLNVEALGQSIQADVFHLYSLKSGAVYGSVLMNFFVIGAPATEWRVAVPEGIGNIDVTGQNVGRDWRREENTVIVPLSRPLLGAATLLISFEEPMSSRGGTISPGGVSPLGVQGERGYVQVVSPLQVNHKSSGDGSLLAIDPSELPAEFRLLSSAPTLGAWQYTARDFTITMDVEWFEPGETIDQVVDFQKLASHISRDGQWVTDARIFVKTRGQSALRLTFPKSAVLWEAKVDGDPVNARTDGGETLVPLPSRADPNQAVEVALRYGARADKATRPVLAAPRLSAPVVIGEWTLTGDDGRRLVPRGGTADLVRPVLAPNGWEWLAGKRRPAFLLAALALAALSFAAMARGSTPRPALFKQLAALGCGALFIALAILLFLASLGSGRDGSSTLEYAAPVVAAGGEVTVVVDNLPAWAARTAAGFWILLAAGLAVAGRGLLRTDRWWTGCGVVLLAAALLTLRGGVPLFFLALIVIGIKWWLPRVVELVASRGRKTATSAAAAAVTGMLAVFAPAPSRAADAPAMNAAESMIHDWQLRDGRLIASVDVVLRAEPGDRFLLLREPAVLTRFDGAGLRVVKAPLPDKGEGYWLVAETGGRLSGRALYEMPLADPAMGWLLPGGPAAMRRVTVAWDRGGWDFASPAAARVTTPPNLPAGHSGATMVLGPVDEVKITARPLQRDADAEETRFFADVSNLYLPGPGVVNGRHQIRIRPAQGRVTALVMKVPAGFTVSDVADGPVGTWRFDPQQSELRVAVEPAQSAGFSFLVETQQGASALPMDLELEPLRVANSAGDLGFLALAFGAEVQPENLETTGLSRVNPEDFPNGLLPLDEDGNPLALLQHAFRHSAGEVSAKLKVTAVAPELRSEVWQLVSLGEDQLLVAADLAVTITRAGVFRLDLDLPDGLEIESATGEGLSHWTEGRAGERRTLTFHLTGKTMGRLEFHLTLTGRATGALPEWQVPRLALRDAARETGLLTIVPERGMQVRSVSRRNVSQIDPRELADNTRESARAAARPGALAYRMLQSDWALGLAIDRLDPWVTASVLHDATIRKGQLLSRVHVSYRIENAAVKSRRIRIPGLDDAAAATVRATGAAVSVMVPVEGENGLWEIRFQRGIAGETAVELEYQRHSTDSGAETVDPVGIEDVRQLSYFVAVRSGGRLELEAGTLPRGWQRADWSVLQSTFGRATGTAAPPALAFRVADPEGPLPVALTRHELAGLRKLRVSEGSLTTLLSPGGEALTAVNLQVRVLDKSTLRLTLPAKARLFHVFVNDEPTNLVREDGDWLFHVPPAPETGQPSVLRFVYSAPLVRGTRLDGPVLDVPLENLNWRVLVPHGWRLARHGGDFDLKQQQALGTFKLEDYQSFVASKRKSDAASAVALLDQANRWLQAGDQEKAGLALGNAARNTQLDAASGEDARVQLRALKTQQAVLGLNTRRQQMVLDNRLAAPGQAENPQLDQAARINPVLRGDSNFDPAQFDRFLEGNTADENSALKEIANRIVAQQLAAEPAPAALDITLPERGTVLEFGRSIQLDGSRPMAIELHLKRQRAASSLWLALPLCLLAGALAASRARKSQGSTERERVTQHQMVGHRDLP